MAANEGPASFATTNWSLVARAIDVDPSIRRDALGALLRTYCPALRGFLVRRLRLPPSEADDLVQGFVADKVLAQNLLERIDRQRGKLRSLLLKSLQRYAFDELRRRRAEDRRLEKLAGMLDEDQPAGDAFALEWARQVLRMALELARAECLERQRIEEWELLEARVVKPALHGIAAPGYEALLPRFGFRDVKQAENALVTGKRRLKRAIEQVIGQYAPPEEVDSEIAELLRIVSVSAPAAAEFEVTTAWGDELDASSVSGLSRLLECEAGTLTYRSDELAGWLGQALIESMAFDGDFRTIGQALDNPRPQMNELLAVERWAQDRAAAPRQTYPAVVIEVVETAALATALVTCGEMTTRVPRSLLAERFDRVAALDWVPQSLRLLAKVAAGVLAD